MVAVPFIFMVLSLASPSMASKHCGRFTSAGQPNCVLGSWRIISATSTNTTGITVYPFGPNPIGYLVFSEDFIFAETIINPDLPRFANGDPTSGSLKDYIAISTGARGNSGTYSVDANGVFTANKIIASTFPNFIGLRSRTDTLNATVSPSGIELVEHFLPAPDQIIDITWKRVTTLHVS
ncbi:MAG: hypothetical protein Q9220_007282 [cf. Caloplaca sp. 1 TL-2023]